MLSLNALGGITCVLDALRLPLKLEGSSIAYFPTKKWHTSPSCMT